MKKTITGATLAIFLMMIFFQACSTPEKKRHVEIFSKERVAKRKVAAQKEQQKKDAARKKAEQKEKRQRLAKLEADKKTRAEERRRQEARAKAAREAAEARKRQQKVEEKVSAEKAFMASLLKKYHHLVQLSPDWDNSAFKFLSVDGTRYTYTDIKEEVQLGDSLFRLNEKGQLFIGLGKKYEVEFGFYDIGTSDHDQFKAFDATVIDREFEVVETKNISNRINVYTLVH
ncbi:MAG: hypothetical protein GY866_28310 [Proteobacteria bacterium]|nr:hypothetical protein [Pseudomonadota bacterium]